MSSCTKQSFCQHVSDLWGPIQMLSMCPQGWRQIIFKWMMNITFAKRHTSIVLQPFDDKWRDLNISSRDLTLPSMLSGATEEIGWSSSFSMCPDLTNCSGIILHNSANPYDKMKHLKIYEKSVKSSKWFFGSARRSKIHCTMSETCNALQLTMKIKI